jgi:hypothetical protein
MRIDFEITYRGETVNLDLTASQMVVSFTLYDGNFPNGGSITQVQSDWNQTNNTQVDFIKNKPTIPSIAGLATETFVTNITDDKVDKVSGKGLSENDLTNTLKSSYDSAVADKHTHVNKSTLDLIEQPLTTGLKDTYDGYSLQISAKANTADVENILYKSTTSTIVTGKTLETSIYSIPLPTDGNNYRIEVYSQAQISTFAGGGFISHRLRVGTYLSPIEGSTGANAIGNQTTIGMHAASSAVQMQLTRRFIFRGGASGSIYGGGAGVNYADDAISIVAFATLKSADFTTQNYLYVSFNPSNTSAVVSHSMIIVKLIKI